MWNLLFHQRPAFYPQILSRLIPQTSLCVSLPSYLVTISSLDRQISLGIWKNFQLKSGDLTKNGVSNDSSL